MELHFKVFKEAKAPRLRRRRASLREWRCARAAARRHLPEPPGSAAPNVELQAACLFFEICFSRDFFTLVDGTEFSRLFNSHREKTPRVFLGSTSFLHEPFHWKVSPFPKYQRKPERSRREPGERGGHHALLYFRRPVGDLSFDHRQREGLRRRHEFPERAFKSRQRPLCGPRGQGHLRRVK